MFSSMIPGGRRRRRLPCSCGHSDRGASFAAVAACRSFSPGASAKTSIKQQLIERLIAVEEQNAAAIAALARSSAEAGELGPTIRRLPLDAYVKNPASAATTPNARTATWI